MTPRRVTETDSKPAAPPRRPRRADALNLPLVPRWDTVVFPNMVGQIVVRNERSQRALEYAANADLHIIVVARRNPPPQEVSLDNLYEVAVEAAIGRIIRLPEGLMNVWIQGVRRVRLAGVAMSDDGFYRGTALVMREKAPPDNEDADIRMRAALGLFEKYVRLSDKVPEEAYVVAMNAREVGPCSDVMAGALAVDVHEQQRLLEMADQRARLEATTELVAREVAVLEMQQRIRGEVQDGIDKSQKEFYIREQMRVLQKELGQLDPIQREAEELREQMEQAGMPEAVQRRVQQELDRLGQMPSAHPEVTMVRNYLDWMVHLPWKADAEEDVDIAQAMTILDRNHYGLPKVKERIIEYMAVRKLAKERLRSPILCFVGPPGVGKTSLGMSIAQALGRKFVRVSLGGIRDEAEVRGHRRTYVGALPGRIIQTIRTAGAINPVFMLDELDKVGADFRGDPSSALLEVLDPEQNHSFSDHYLEVPYDLSKVFFIATANLLEPIIPALRDRLEIIELSGYTEREKLGIARQFLVPKQIKENGLTEHPVDFSTGALRTVVEHYTREAGVRNLEREIGNVCRKIARTVAEGHKPPAAVSAQSVAKYLGPQKFFFGAAELEDQVGVATGVAKTEQGGDVLPVEVTLLEGKGTLILTGQLGEVMRESAQAAVSYARSRAAALGYDPGLFEKTDIHIHVPAGAVPKDGPSAGITLATALISALTGRAVSRDVAMTGEITLRGRVLPIGGLKDKVLAAHRAGIHTFVAPDRNRKDLDDLPADVRREVRFVWADQMDQVLATALANPTPVLFAPVG